MSDRPRDAGWWLASDGKWYPPEARPGEPAPPSHGPAGPPALPGRLSPGLTGTLRAFLIGTAVVGILAAASRIREVGFFNSFWENQSFSRLIELDDAERLTGNVIAVWFIGLAVTGILTVVWFYKAYAAAAGRGETGTRWSPGWGIGAWFIPLANLVIPKLVFDEFSRLASARTLPAPVGTRWWNEPKIPAGHWWWGLMIGGLIVISIGSAVSGGEIENLDLGTFDSARYRGGLWAISIGLLLHSLSAFPASAAFKRVGSQLSDPGVPPSL